MLIALYDFPEARKSVRNYKMLVKSADKEYKSVRIHQRVQFLHAESCGVARVPVRFPATSRLTTSDENLLTRNCRRTVSIRLAVVRWMPTTGAFRSVLTSRGPVFDEVKELRRTLIREALETRPDLSIRGK
jgi:hypothetical protein